MSGPNVDQILQIVGMLSFIGFFLGVVYFAKSLKRIEDAADRIEIAAALVADELVPNNAALDKSLGSLERWQTRQAADAARVKKDLGTADLKKSSRLEEIAATQNRMEAAAVVVATNLEASIERASEEDKAVPGKSADAALRRAAEEDG